MVILNGHPCGMEQASVNDGQLVEVFDVRVQYSVWHARGSSNFEGQFTVDLVEAVENVNRRGCGLLSR